MTVSSEDNGQRGATAQSPTNNLSQSVQFLALLRTRDRELASLGELNRISAYHENFKGRLERLSFNPLGDSAIRDQMVARINAALTRLQRFENDVKAASDLPAKIRLTDKFDNDFPLTPEELDIRPTRASSSRASISDRDSFVQRERVSANEVFQNVSIENREWLRRYERIYTEIDSQIVDSTPNFARLDKLPSGFNRLAGASSIKDMTAEQIQTAIEEYRNTLKATIGDITAAPRPDSNDAARRAIMAKVDQLGRDLQSKSLEADTQFKNLEASIASSAKTLFGNKVGADSFNYLLIVFAGVFIVLMTMPKFYSEAIATNVLKSEFLLQFSTVFVLIAAIIILGIGELIDKEQLPVLLAGISGYVLGQLGKA